MAACRAYRRLCVAWPPCRPRPPYAPCPLWGPHARLAAPIACGSPACVTTSASGNLQGPYFRVYSCSSLLMLPIKTLRQAPRHALRIRAVAFALVKRLLNIMFGNEIGDHG